MPEPPMAPRGEAPPPRRSTRRRWTRRTGYSLLHLVRRRGARGNLRPAARPRSAARRGVGSCRTDVRPAPRRPFDLRARRDDGALHVGRSLSVDGRGLAPRDDGRVSPLAPDARRRSAQRRTIEGGDASLAQSTRSTVVASQRPDLPARARPGGERGRVSRAPRSNRDRRDREHRRDGCRDRSRDDLRSDGSPGGFGAERADCRGLAAAARRRGEFEPARGRGRRVDRAPARRRRRRRTRRHDDRRGVRAARPEVRPSNGPSTKVDVGRFDVTTLSLTGRLGHRDVSLVARIEGGEIVVAPEAIRIAVASLVADVAPVPGLIPATAHVRLGGGCASQRRGSKFPSST